MKRVLLYLIVSCTTLASAAQTKALSANEVLQVAYKKAASEHKNVLVIFTASWCGWCKKMDASINDTACKQLFDEHYIITHLTVHETARKKKSENPGADSLLKNIHAFTAGVPVWLIYDENGKLLSDSFVKNAGGERTNIGCPSSEKEVQAFVNILKATSSLTDTELTTISSVFRNNDTQ